VRDLYVIVEGVEADKVLELVSVLGATVHNSTAWLSSLENIQGENEP
jgi:hypothetical protein